ncbi:uncharacterized protein ACHE_31351S [Aspergillus chevalieri]|uniref:Uncharacterized protein n=1 Tax=Aspergillus chevalieri TaxID=182096 RepID=A0A7R7ZN66_ASPCH|nr:uncharacterized protein ACHE_31351S [Aspergillus chevalieri]BCR87364.1 hypothetical protein ACHE_31351S [Aspergillus chevalieri]
MMDEFRDECKLAWRSLGLNGNSAMEENAIDLKVPEGRQDFINLTLRQIKPEDQLEFFREISYAIVCRPDAYCQQADTVVAHRRLQH